MALGRPDVNAGLAESQPLSELGLGDISGEGQVQYPNSHSGLVLQAAAKMAFPMGPATALEFGADLSFLSQNKADQPLTVDSSFSTEQGDMGQAELSTEQTYSYTYLTLMAGLTSYLQALDLYLSYYLRMAAGGSLFRKRREPHRVSHSLTGYR